MKLLLLESDALPRPHSELPILRFALYCLFRVGREDFGPGIVGFGGGHPIYMQDAPVSALRFLNRAVHRHGQGRMNRPVERHSYRAGCQRSQKIETNR